MSNSNVVTRFAPSPTGFLHAGNYRTALFCYIFAKQNKGKFILRIEDSDRNRSKKEYEDNILESLKWLDITYDGFYRQSDRVSVHRSYIQKLLDKDLAYVSKETPKEEGEREEVIRFRNPNKKVRFHDLIRGDIVFDTTEHGDFVIARSMDEPIFHLAVVIDDHDMGITHVFRGEDHISNTARHILLQEALGFPVPVYAHFPLLLSPDRSKLSKRKGAEPMTAYRDKGYVPQAMINYIALLGWNPGTDQELFSLDDLIAHFKIEKIQKGAAIFDDEKLKWFNRRYVLKMSDDEFMEHAVAFVPEWLSTGSRTFKAVLPLLREKISAFGDIAKLFAAGGEFDFIQSLRDFPPEMLLWKKNPSREAARKHIIRAREAIEGLPDSETAFTAEAVKSALWKYAEENGKGDVLWPLRTALTGQERSPDPFTSAAILGKVESLKRIDSALAKLA